MHEPGAQSQREGTSAARRRHRSPAAYYGLLGTTVLLLTFWLPIASARRTARAEGRGDALAALLLEAAVDLQPLELASGPARECLQGRLLALATAQGVFVDDLTLLPADARPALTFTNKHYCIQLRPAAVPGPPAPGAPPAPAGLALPLEVLAWPLESTGPAHAVFFYPEDAEPAYTRNLQSGYMGLDPEHWPAPGQAHRRPGGVDQHWSYRGRDDERWLLPHRRAGGAPRRVARRGRGIRSIRTENRAAARASTRSRSAACA